MHIRVCVFFKDIVNIRMRIVNFKNILCHCRASVTINVTLITTYDYLAPRKNKNTNLKVINIKM